MNDDTEPEKHPGPEAPRSDSDPAAAESARVVARTNHLFRYVGDNTPARLLEQQLIAYRLGVRSG